MNELFYSIVDFEKVNWVNRKQSEKKTFIKKRFFIPFACSELVHRMIAGVICKLKTRCFNNNRK